MELKDRIALARKQAGLSQEQLGERLGVSRQAVSKWESGQANPDVTYVAAMCRLFGLSSDWLLLGEEGAQSTAPARCPGCQAVVTGLDRFCPSCGYNLREGSGEERYLLLLTARKTDFSDPQEDLVRLSRSKIFSEDSPLWGLGSFQRAEELAQSAPLILGRGLSRKEVEFLWRELTYKVHFAVLRDNGETDLQALMNCPPVDMDRLVPKEKPLTFWKTVLAVMTGSIALWLLTLLLAQLLAWLL